MLTRDWLRHYSAEVTAGDRKSIAAAGVMMSPGSEVYVASLPHDRQDRTVAAAAELKRAGLSPVPHIAARNLGSVRDFDTLLGRLTGEAGVRRVLLLAGDRDPPAGDLHSSLQLIETGLLSVHGIRQIVLAVYPESHPRIGAADLIAARRAKLAAAEKARMETLFISQFCFESAPIIAMTRALRADGVTTPLRVGLAGPANRASLLKYAVICGVGASMRALTERPGSRALLSGTTPAPLMGELADAQERNAALGIEGVHFFTFSSLAATARFVSEQLGLRQPAQ